MVGSGGGEGAGCEAPPSTAAWAAWAAWAWAGISDMPLPRFQGRWGGGEGRRARQTGQRRNLWTGRGRLAGRCSGSFRATIGLTGCLRKEGSDHQRHLGLASPTMHERGLPLLHIALARIAASHHSHPPASRAASRREVLPAWCAGSPSG